MSLRGVSLGTRGDKYATTRVTRTPVSSLVQDWNTRGTRAPAAVEAAAILDDTLRDGLQSTAVRQPALEARVELLAATACAGVGAVHLGLTGISAEASRVVERLPRKGARSGSAWCARRASACAIP